MSAKRKGFFNSTDRKLLGAALVLIFFSLYYLLVDETLFGILRSGDDDSSRPLVGQISTLENDTRHKSMKSFVWSKARRDQQVRIGDSVFTGASSKSRVDLSEGGHVDMGENTLINFDDLRGFKVPNLRMGNFKLAVNGTMRVAIANEITEIKGDGAEVQVVLTENEKPKIIVTKGDPVVKSSIPVKKKDQALAPPPAPVAKAAPPTPPPQPPAPIEPPKLEMKPLPETSIFLYTDQLYDFYERMPQSLRKRAERRRQVDFPVQLKWTANQNVPKTYGQISETPGFEKAVQFFETTEQGTYNHRPVYLGTNYWRVSNDRNQWSTTEYFQVESQPLNSEPPEIKLEKEHLYVLNDSIQAHAQINAPDDQKAFVIEMSADPHFAAEKVQAHWAGQRSITWNFSHAGEYYFRARGVNDKTEITKSGPVTKLSVYRPLRAEPPRLAQNQIQVFENEQVNLSWEKSPLAKAYAVELVNPEGKVIQRQKVSDSKWSWKAGPRGAYQARVTAMDQFGRTSEQASQTQVLVSSKPKPIAKKVAAPLPRKPANADSTLSMKADQPPPPFLNRNYPSSKVELAGAGFTMYSSEQLAQNAEQPVAFMLGLHVQHWFGEHHGADGYLKTKVMGVNKGAGDTSPFQAEVRYNYRWKIPWNFMSKLNESQISAIIGYEMYRNQSAGLIYTPSYDLMKVGFGLAFPLWERWDTGGEVLYGQGFDTSTKYEISGFLNYYLRRDWSAGVGYRLHLFTAGSNASAPPAGLPFREGFGEAYSVLRWHY